MSRRAVVAMTLTLAVVAGALLVAEHRARDRSAAPSPLARAPRLPAPPPRPRRVAAAPPTLGEPAPEAVAEVAQRDGLAFARDYADAVCACADAACVAATDGEFAERLGEALPTNDTSGLYATFARADACARERRREVAPP